MDCRLSNTLSYFMKPAERATQLHNRTYLSTSIDQVTTYAYNYYRIQSFCNEQTKKQTNFKLLTFLISLIKPRPDAWHHLWMETVPQNLKENYSIVVVYINYEFKVVFLFFSSSWETLHFFSCGVELSKSIKALKKSNRYERRHQN